MPVDPSSGDLQSNPATIPLGNCFQWAFQEQARLAAKNVSSILIQAVVIDPWDGHSFWHSWLEYHGRAYDWQSVVALSQPKGRTIKQFREIWKPYQESRYTRLEAIQMLFKYQHFGPWVDFESE